MTRFPTLEAVAQWLGQGALHPPPFSLDAAEAVVEEAIMVRAAMDRQGVYYTLLTSDSSPPATRPRIELHY